MVCAALMREPVLGSIFEACAPAGSARKRGAIVSAAVAQVLRRGSIDRGPDPFLADVLAGLASRPRAIPSKYLWDARGSALFEQLAETPEYYLTRAERELLSAHREEIADSIGPRATLVELGPGNAHKTRLLIDCADLERYVPIDVDGGMLERIAGELAEVHAEIDIDPRCADFGAGLPRIERGAGRTVLLFAGSGIGNFHPHEAVSLLARAAIAIGKDGVLLVGVDLKKSKKVIEAAYHDRRGITGALNRNVLARINREIGATIDVTRFSHRAPYDPIRGRVEMRLVSECDQRFEIDGHEIRIASGEWIVTEHCYKYDLAEFRQLARRAGLIPGRAYTDAERRVSLHELFVR